MTDLLLLSFNKRIRLAGTVKAEKNVALHCTYNVVFRQGFL